MTDNSIQKLSTSKPNRLRVTLGDELISIKSVAGLDIKFSSVEYKDGTGGIFRMPGERETTSFTLTTGVLKDNNPLYRWLETIGSNHVDKRDMMFSLTDENCTELLVSWCVTNAFPTGISWNLDNAFGTCVCNDDDLVMQEISVMADRIVLIQH